MGTDPLRQMPYLLRQLDALGFSGINNFPTVGLIDGRFRMELEATNMGFGKEVDMIRLAHEMGFFTAVYVFNPDEARAMAEAGADCIIAHMGLTVGGSIGLDRGDAMSLEDAPAAVQAIGEARLGREHGRDPPLPRRPDRHPGRLRLRPRPLRRGRLRRRLLDGAPAGRDRHHQHGGGIQTGVVPETYGIMMSKTCR